MALALPVPEPPWPASLSSLKVREARREGERDWRAGCQRGGRGAARPQAEPRRHRSPLCPVRCAAGGRQAGRGRPSAALPGGGTRARPAPPGPAVPPRGAERRPSAGPGPARPRRGAPGREGPETEFRPRLVPAICLDVRGVRTYRHGRRGWKRALASLPLAQDVPP